MKDVASYYAFRKKISCISCNSRISAKPRILPTLIFELLAHIIFWGMTILAINNKSWLIFSIGIIGFGTALFIGSLFSKYEVLINRHNRIERNIAL